MCIESRHLKVGDVILVRKDESFPADLVVMASSNADYVSYVLTSNLDGETNLKIKYNHKET